MFAMSPWLMSVPLGLVAGLTGHLGWFAACERLLPSAPPSSVPMSKPAASVALAAPRPVTAPPPRPNAAPAARPAAPDSAAARSPRGFVQTPVLAVIDETHDIRTFRMARPDGFDFKAGQFLAIRLRADGKEHVRCYSISSPPGARGLLEISVKRVGAVSGALHATVRPGSMLSVKSPVGAFVYPAGEDRALVLIAGGVGITPLMSMLRHAVGDEPSRPVTLFYSVRKQEDLAFYDELRLLERRHAQVRVVVAITEGPAAGSFYPGHINEALLTTMAPDIEHGACFVCGPPPMIEAMKATLLAIGVPRQQIHYEIFKAAIAAAAGPPPVEDEAPAAPAPVASAPVAASAYDVRFARSGMAGTAAAEQTLLEVAEAAGAPIPSLCRAGVCGTCRTRVTSGSVDCAAKTLDAQDRQDGFVLPCVSRVQSACTVDA